VDAIASGNLPTADPISNLAGAATSAIPVAQRKAQIAAKDVRFPYYYFVLYNTHLLALV